MPSGLAAHSGVCLRLGAAAQARRLSGGSGQK